MKPIEEMTDLELREAVAVEVMGWTRDEDGWDDHGRLVVDEPLFESSIEAAFQVVEKLEAAPENWLFKAVRQGGVLTRQVDKIAWMCEFRACIGPAGHAFYAIGVDEKSLPLAICRAALKAARAK